MRKLITLVAFVVGIAAATARGQVATLKEWIGKTQAEVTKTYKGKPFHEDKYPATKAPGELRNKVSKAYPANDPASAKVEIHEVWWSEGDFRTTFLFHLKGGKWVVLDAIRWHKDTVF